MATATYPGAAGFTAKTEADKFIPEIWSDEIIAAYQKNLKMACGSWKHLAIVIMLEILIEDRASQDI